MATGKLPLSRKAKRKQERNDKKRRRTSGSARRRMRHLQLIETPATHRPSGITNKFHEFLAEAANTKAGEPSGEDKEIKALEAKLGLGSSSSSKSESALRKLKKEYSKDGLGEDFADFLSGLDHISEVVKGRPKAAKHRLHMMRTDSTRDGDATGGRRRVLEGHDELPTDESESESEDLAQFYSDEEEDEDDDEARANAMRNQQLADDSAELAMAVKAEADSDGDDKLEEEDVSDEDGDAEESDKNDDEEEQEKEESVVVGEDIYGRPKPSAYLPPHLRRKLQAEAEAAAAAAATDKVKPSQMDEQAMRELTRRITASSIVSPSPTWIGGFFVEKLVRKLMDSVEEEKKLLSESADTQHDDEDDAVRTSKVPVNLMLFVMMLYNFGVVHCTLVYDLFRSFVDSFSSTDIELIHQLLKIGGAQLRSDDADALPESGEAQQANGGKQPEERVRFILDLIYDLKKSSKHGKGGKNGAGGGTLDVSSLKKWLGRVKTRCGNANNPLRVSLHELLNADEDGRWWSSEARGSATSSRSRAMTRQTTMQRMKLHGDRQLLKLAEKQHMNTDIRKKIFVALMGATDCFDAYERLLQLHLKEKQEREIVRVLLHCCGQENKFNKYYLVLAEKLCEMDPRYKFTFQLAFWDIFKQMSRSSRGDCTTKVKCWLDLCLSSCLSLSCLKVMDFTQLEEKSILFLRVLMEEILKAESELEMAQVFQRLLQTKKAQLTIDGLAVFFHQHLTSFRGEPDPKQDHC
ncbi:Armadillo-type fold [Phytophthora cactorum]|nr:Armadillo-type fold [Phytophthora cactorum]